MEGNSGISTKDRRDISRSEQHSEMPVDHNEQLRHSLLETENLSDFIQIIKAVGADDSLQSLDTLSETSSSSLDELASHIENLIVTTSEVSFHGVKQEFHNLGNQFYELGKELMLATEPFIKQWKQGSSSSTKEWIAQLLVTVAKGLAKSGLFDVTNESCVEGANRTTGGNITIAFVLRLFALEYELNNYQLNSQELLIACRELQTLLVNGRKGNTGMFLSFDCHQRLKALSELLPLQVNGIDKLRFDPALIETVITLLENLPPFIDNIHPAMCKAVAPRISGIDVLSPVAIEKLLDFYCFSSDKELHDTVHKVLARHIICNVGKLSSRAVYCAFKSFIKLQPCAERDAALKALGPSISKAPVLARCDILDLTAILDHHQELNLDDMALVVLLGALAKRIGNIRGEFEFAGTTIKSLLALPYNVEVQAVLDSIGRNANFSSTLQPWTYLLRALKDQNASQVTDMVLNLLTERIKGEESIHPLYIAEAICNLSFLLQAKSIVAANFVSTLLTKCAISFDKEQLHTLHQQQKIIREVLKDRHTSDQIDLKNLTPEITGFYLSTIFGETNHLSLANLTLSYGKLGKSLYKRDPFFHSIKIIYGVSEERKSIVQEVLSAHPNVFNGTWIYEDQKGYLDEGTGLLLPNHIVVKWS